MFIRSPVVADRFLGTIRAHGFFNVKVFPLVIKVPQAILQVVVG
jgi:hypothetical protein